VAAAGAAGRPFSVVRGPRQPQSTSCFRVQAAAAPFAGRSILDAARRPPPSRVASGGLKVGAMAFPIMQSTRMGWYLSAASAGQAREVSVDRRARAAVSVLKPPPCSGCADPSNPPITSCVAGFRAHRPRGDEGDRCAYGLNRGR